MAKGTVMDEVLILKFFETGPIEKVEVVFNIVNDKVRERLRGRGSEGGETTPRAAARKRPAGTGAGGAAGGGATPAPGA
jgi:hypothetical protein